MRVFHYIRKPWPEYQHEGIWSPSMLPRGECSVQAYFVQFSNWEYPWNSRFQLVSTYVLHEDHDGVWPLAIKKIERAAESYAYHHELKVMYVLPGHANSNRHPRRRGFDRNGHVCCESTWAGWYCYTCGAQH